MRSNHCARLFAAHNRDNFKGCRGAAPIAKSIPETGENQHPKSFLQGSIHAAGSELLGPIPDPNRARLHDLGIDTAQVKLFLLG